MPHLLTTKHIAYSNGSGRNQSYPGFSGAITGLNSVITTDSSSRVRPKSAPLPLCPPSLVGSAGSLQALAKCYDPLLSASEVEYVRKRMRRSKDYLNMEPGSRDKSMSDDLSAALKSMCQAFDRSIKFTGQHAEKVKPGFSEPQDETMHRNKDVLGSAKEDASGIMSPEENRGFIDAGKKDTGGLHLRAQTAVSIRHRPLRARGSHSDNNFLSKRSKSFGDFKIKRGTRSAPGFFGFHNILFARFRSKAGESKDAPQFLQRSFSTPRPAQNASASREGDTHSLPKKDSRSINEYPGPRYSQRLFQLRNKASNRQKANEPLEHQASKKRKGVHRSGRLTSGRLHSSTDHTTSTEKLTVKIPADTDMATDLRAYRQWPGRYKFEFPTKPDLITLYRRFWVLAKNPGLSPPCQLSVLGHSGVRVDLSCAVLPDVFPESEQAQFPFRCTLLWLPKRWIIQHMTN